nr:hypothetical protein [Mucilaginibacter sp. FT3.2]
MEEEAFAGLAGIIIKDIYITGRSGFNEEAGVLTINKRKRNLNK